MTSGFDVKMLGEAIARALGLREGETVEIQKDLLDRNRLVVLRHPQEESKP